MTLGVYQPRIYVQLFNIFSLQPEYCHLAMRRVHFLMYDNYFDSKDEIIENTLCIT